MAYPLAGCFVSAILLKRRHLCGFSVSSNPPCGEGIKGRFKRFSRRFPTVFLCLKNPLAFPINRLSPPQILPFSAFFLNSVTWMSRENVSKSSLQKNSRWFWGAVGEDFKPQIQDMRCVKRPFQICLSGKKDPLDVPPASWTIIKQPQNEIRIPNIVQMRWRLLKKRNWSPKYKLLREKQLNLCAFWYQRLY